MIDCSMKIRMNFGEKEVPKSYIGFVYLTYFPNGKIYIGKTTRRVESIYFGSGGRQFLLALKEFGKINIVRYILRFCFSREELSKYERVYCKIFNSTDSTIGYNYFEGDCDFSLKNPSKEQSFKHNQSLLMKKLKLMDDVEIRIKISASTTGCLNHFYGKTHSENTKKLLSNIFKEIPTNRKPWNKGLSLKDDERFKKRYKDLKSNNPVRTGDEHWTRQIKNRKMSETTKEKIKNKAIERLQNIEAKNKILKNLKQFQ